MKIWFQWTRLTARSFIAHTCYIITLLTLRQIELVYKEGTHFTLCLISSGLSRAFSVGTICQKKCEARAQHNRNAITTRVDSVLYKSRFNLSLTMSKSLHFALVKIKLSNNLGKGSIIKKKKSLEFSTPSGGTPPPPKVWNKYFFLFHIWVLKSVLMRRNFFFFFFQSTYPWF